MIAGGLQAFPYWSRLACVILAAGAAAYALGATLAALAATLLLRRLENTERHYPARAAGVALALRLLPLSAASLAALALALPSFLWLEPRGGGAEHVGGLCCALALAGAAGLSFIAARLTRACGASWRYQRQARRDGESRTLANRRVQVLPGPAASLAVAGTLRPLLTISRSALAELTAEQLALALGHEQAHRTAGDNWKRLMLLAAPVPGVGARELERAWARWAEWAADDFATGGDASRSLTLASALLAVARLGAAATCSRLVPVLSTLERGSGRDLSERIARLLACEGAHTAPRRWVGFAIAAALLWLTLQPTTLLAAHAVLERLVH
ncbi:MAG: hypothetical protein ACRD1C_14190 [Terriglobales bacterium]